MNRRNLHSAAVAFLLAAALAGCAAPAPRPQRPVAVLGAGGDPHSWSRPAEARVEHLSLDLTLDFERRTLAGTALLEIATSPGASELVLDTRGLRIASVRIDLPAGATSWSLGEEEPHVGRPLAIDISPHTRRVMIRYSTSPDAGALQWLPPEATAGGRSPFLFSQSQAILARTWVPCQDSPAVRFAYEATIRVPPGDLALMSAENPIEPAPDGVHRFRMEQPIPSYLLALAAGDLAFRPLGPRTGVYAEPELVEDSAREFRDVGQMLEIAEGLYGPYRWERYDLLVLPPAFPFGGMENPRLTFLTPTLLAGDRSLVSLVAHELAHSWSGNLVTNATWNDFWLNEGLTTYIERRIMEELEGAEVAEMLWSLGFQDLEEAIAELPPEDTRLQLDLAGRDPDEGMTDVAYEKGALLLRTLERRAGRAALDAFLGGWFETRAFEAVDSGDFVAAATAELLDPAGLPSADVDLDAWIHGPGIPEGAALPRPEAFDRVETALERWRAGTPADELATADWTTHHWLHFLRSLAADPPLPDRLAELDATFDLTASGNAEVLAAWLELAILEGYRPADPAVERFLVSVGRRKFLEPLYRALAETPEGLERARAIYERAREGYHPLARGTVEGILGETP